MHDRIHFVEHQGFEILFADFSNCTAREVEKVARAVPDYASMKPRKSVLILSDFTGASFDEEAIRALKEAAVFDKPFVSKSALIGTQTFPTTFITDVKKYSRRDLVIFGTRKEALAWLIKDPQAN
jgi:hypothetical protein